METAMNYLPDFSQRFFRTVLCRRHKVSSPCGVSRCARLDSSYNMNQVRNSRNL